MENTQDAQTQLSRKKKTKGVQATRGESLQDSVEDYSWVVGLCERDVERAFLNLSSFESDWMKSVMFLEEEFVPVRRDFHGILVMSFKKLSTEERDFS